MPLFKRKPSTPSTPGVSVAVLMLEGHDMIEKTAAAHRDRWGLRDADRWDLDQTSGKIKWTFADRLAEAPVQVLGS